MAGKICRYDLAVWNSGQGDDTSFFGDVAILFPSIWHINIEVFFLFVNSLLFVLLWCAKNRRWTALDFHLYALCGCSIRREDVVYRYCRWANGSVYWLSSIVVFHGIIRKGVRSGLWIQKLVGNLNRKRSYLVGWAIAARNCWVKLGRSRLVKKSPKMASCKGLE